jgi:D-alanyl-lipoteichoic acid acyltransferase DltB (MBOAT superfamily)
MLFNSIDFAIFLPIVFGIYWFLNRYDLKYQNLFLLVVSYVFYGWWDWRFLSLILFSSIVDYTIGLKLSKESHPVKRKYFLWMSILVNLGMLGFFKYFNFFMDNFTTAFSFFGYEIAGTSLNVILPVGISFYTFQTLSYTIDIYRDKLEPSKDPVVFFAFVSFFPQLVAGPIERAKNLLPQFHIRREFDQANAINGLRQILWGLFKKIVVADSCAEIANYIFSNSAELNGSSLLLGAIFFTFQIYGDFSGYSDIAIGVSKLFGFNLMRNFAFPYFSRDIAEFWRRWHISLSTWFRDYLYIPLGGSRVSKGRAVFNTFVIFIVSGFWHGANWTFIFWGALNAVYFLPLLLSKNNRNNLDIIASERYLPSLKEFGKVMITFSLTVLGWIFFRADNLVHAFSFLGELLSPTLFSVPTLLGGFDVGLVLFLIVVMLTIEWFGRTADFALGTFALKWKRPLRLAFYYTLALSIIWFSGKEQEFIYFQF